MLRIPQTVRTAGYSVRGRICHGVADPRTIRTELVEAHGATLAATVDAARAVVVGWDGDAVGDPDRITAFLEGELRDRGLATDLLALLHTGADVLDTEVQGDPVAAPPYLAVTGRGPVVRATLGDGRRLVVVVSLFAVERDPTRYRFRDPGIEAVLGVDLR